MLLFRENFFQIKVAFDAINSTYNIQVLKKSNSRTHRLFKLNKRS